MKGDFTRDTFDPRKGYSRVLSQQGRVTLDADANEAASIALHHQRTLARDLLGPYAGPQRGGGFELTMSEDGLYIEPGRYYVDGILVDNPTRVRLADQPHLTLNDDPLQKAVNEGPLGKAFWLYLDVWERHVTWIEDGAILESALGGPDTCSRAKIVWQVRAVELQPGAAGGATAPREGSFGECDAGIANLFALSDAALAARVDPGASPDDPCILPPESKYRGPENQLYRVEVHRGGTADVATFKWSRDNGSVATPLLEVAHGGLSVGRTRGFEAGDWIELNEDANELRGEPGLLTQVARIEDGVLGIDDEALLGEVVNGLENAVNPKVRRWNQRSNDKTGLVDGAVRIRENAEDGGGWIDLEYGIQVRFAPGGTYRTGDYWLIPARVATGKVEWLTEDDEPALVAAHGIEHHYAPLAFVGWPQGQATISDCRCLFATLTPCFQDDNDQAPRGKVLPRRYSPKAAVDVAFAGDTAPKAKRTKKGQKG